MDFYKVVGPIGKNNNGVFIVMSHDGMLDAIDSVTVDATIHFESFPRSFPVLVFIEELAGGGDVGCTVIEADRFVTNYLSDERLYGTGKVFTLQEILLASAGDLKA